MVRSMGIRERILMLLLCMTLPLQQAAAGSRREVAVPWSSLEELIGQKKVSLMTPDGVLIRGKALDVEADALVMLVQESSDPGVHPKGPGRIPRASVSTIQMTETRGRGRALAAAVGAGGGAAVGWVIAAGVFHVSGEGKGLLKEPKGIGLLLGLGGGGAAAGYLIGRDLDKVEVYIRVLP